MVVRIGAGGMGEVWRARDTRLDRSVAVKILPAEFSTDAGLRLRFEREAKLISQLNHPHICSLFDVGEGYLVMELIDGEALDDRLARGALPIADVLRYGAQIADALDRAHRAGIVHRDLKPGNIMITRAGAKLLDFGLAKAAEAAPSADHATELKPLTQEGTIVGTFQYMAPEQLEGSRADARTDLFALGAVLYEMATGKRAFEGKTKTSLIAAIVAGQPKPIAELQPLTPPALEHVIAKCLSKDPEDRWQSAHDVAEELKWIGSAGSKATVAVRGRKPWGWIVALLALGAIAAWLALRPKPRPGVLEAELASSVNRGLQYLSGPPALSPDGRMLVYAAPDENGRRMLWLRSLDGGSTRLIAGTTDAFVPFWSPDGQSIGFTTPRGDVKRIGLGGGDAQTVATLTNGGWGWNRDDVILYTNLNAGSVSRVRATGGEPTSVLTPQTLGCRALFWPSFLPDGNHFLVTALGGEVAKRRQDGVWVATLDQSEKPRFLARTNVNVMYVEPGYLLVVQDGVLRALPFDAKRLRVTGDALTIAPVQVYTVAAYFTASNTGLLIYQPPGTLNRSELVVKNRKGEVLRKVGAPGFYYAPRISPDGRRIAVDVSDERATGDIWVLDLEDGAATRFSFDAENETAPLWSARGDEIVYSLTVPPNGTVIPRKQLGGVPQTLAEFKEKPVVLTDWSPDGNYFAVYGATVRTDPDLGVWSIRDHKLIPIAASPASEGVGNFSPDGKWIAYQSEESGRREIYVQPFPPTGAKYQVSTNGGVTARWSRRGEIFWVDPDLRLNVAAISTEPFRIGLPSVLFPIDQRNNSAWQYDVFPDGHILVNQTVPTQGKPMTLLVNWTRRFEK